MTRCGKPARARKSRCHDHDRGVRRAPANNRRSTKRGGIAACLTPEEWQAIYHSQRGRCVICRKHLRNRFDPTDRRQVAAVDHRHGVLPRLRGIKASVRGLLCAFPCNRWLYSFWTAARLARAAEYVRTMPAQRVLNAGD